MSVQNTKILATDVNSANSSVFTIGNNAKKSSELSSWSLNTSAGNNVTSGAVAKKVNLTNIKSAINKLETLFSGNCCQAQCNATSTTSSCQVCQNYTNTYTCQANAYTCQTYTQNYVCQAYAIKSTTYVIKYNIIYHVTYNYKNVNCYIACQSCQVNCNYGCQNQCGYTNCVNGCV